MAGRPKTITTEHLKEIVRQYQRNNIGKKIMIPDLVRYSGISKNTWYRNEEIIEYIKQANFTPLMIKAQSAEIPSENDIFKACGNDVEKYQEFIRKLLDTIDAMDREREKLKRELKGVSSTEVNELNEKVKEQEKIIKNLTDKLNYATSENDSLINLSDNLDKLDVRTFSEQFKELFE